MMTSCGGGEWLVVTAARFDVKVADDPSFHAMAPYCAPSARAR